jgi:hypothetical protein
VRLGRGERQRVILYTPLPEDAAPAKMRRLLANRAHVR